MAATSAAIVMMKPAEAARAPEGPTNTATGVRQLSMASTICRIEVSRPPGVSSLDHEKRSVGQVGALDRGHDVGCRDRVHDPVERNHRDIGRGPLGEHDQDGHRQRYPGDTQHG